MLPDLESDTIVPEVVPTYNDPSERLTATVDWMSTDPS
jgi:hypothetical protein